MRTGCEDVSKVQHGWKKMIKHLINRNPMNKHSWKVSNLSQLRLKGDSTKKVYLSSESLGIVIDGLAYIKSIDAEYKSLMK